jgi:proteasome lid subunit RPN8/RPN11
MQLLSLSLPEYKVDTEPDHKSIGKKIDDELKKCFMGHSILVRGIGSQEHPDKTVDELIQTIANTGTDRYDSQRAGDRYENIQGKHIDLFAFPAHVQQDLEVGDQVVYGFYHSAIGIHGRPTRIDILTIYKADQFEVVEHQYEGRDDVKRDGFVFKDPARKQEAVLGIIKLT